MEDKISKTDEELLEAVPQNFPQLLLIIHRQATFEIGRDNIGGFTQIVKTLHEQLSSFHDKKYLDAKAELDKKLYDKMEKIEELHKTNRHEGIRSSRIRYATREWAIKLLGLLSGLEGRKGLLVAKTTVIGDKE